MMDGAPGPVGDPLKIGMVPNPVFITINPDDQKQISGSVKSITIIVCVNRNRLNPFTKSSILLAQGTDILSVDLTEIMVTVGGQPCVINTNLVTSTVSGH